MLIITPAIPTIFTAPTAFLWWGALTLSLRQPEIQCHLKCGVMLYTYRWGDGGTYSECSRSEGQSGEAEGDESIEVHDDFVDSR